MRLRRHNATIVCKSERTLPTCLYHSSHSTTNGTSRLRDHYRCNIINDVLRQHTTLIATFPLRESRRKSTRNSFVQLRVWRHLRSFAWMLKSLGHRIQNISTTSSTTLDKVSRGAAGIGVHQASHSHRQHHTMRGPW